MSRFRPITRRVVTVALVAAVACAAPPATAPAPVATGAATRDAARAAAPSDLTLAEVGDLRRARDYFTLRDRLRGQSDDVDLPALVARAVVDHAFNRPAASNDAITTALDRPDLPDTLDLQLREMEAANHLRRHDYAHALAAADTLIARHDGRADSARLESVRNLRKIVSALADVPAQTVRADGPTRLTLARGRIPVAFGDEVREYVFDTGANISTIMRSEAEALGLDVRPAGIDVGTSTDARISADVGIARTVRIGAMEFRNVAFLVVDDAALTFGDFRIPGIIGFPVIEAMGEIRLGTTGELIVPGTLPPRPVRNLALDGFTPLTAAGWEGEPLICRLDTGADDTDFYEPFYRQFRAGLDSLGTAKTRRMGGVGGVRELPVVELPRMVLAVGDTMAAIETVDVLTTRITRTEDENFIDCNIGHDILDQFAEYVINFRDMSFLLR